ncbi:Endonuclease/exonuclease/phosphatase family protein [Tenacibaculum maritimum]|uniref:endonuclease/exonuclease/phosphatase family protein n=1 Tax=Tenacibaculum maritimum TaxID=107401 RepID=UPI0012E60F80|nr:endonuclease [Tenacibaculum maritimum]CAA0181379.1 Endonuclease/exonuclease/phosphatase family protein [Tenacibaculum maritimum]
MMLSKNKENIHTVAFYNVENLFDISNDLSKMDDDFTIKGRRRWSVKRYKKKVKNISTVLAKIGIEKSLYPPSLVGLVEIENKGVLLDMIHHPKLRECFYNFVHYDSPDERGIDVALLYDKRFFELLASKKIPLILRYSSGGRDYTRDILLVKGKLKGELVYILVNHWPSRAVGKENGSKRMEASKLLNTVVSNIREEDMDAKIIIMGDFNDNPTDDSIKRIVQNNFYNPMEDLHQKGKGILTYKGNWHLFDQIIISKSLLEKNESFCFKGVDVFNKKWLRVFEGKLKGSPFRTYAGARYKGGFSDHFPVCAYFECK